MLYVVLTIIVLAVVALAISAVVGYFNSGAGRTKKELAEAHASLAIERERVSVAQSALLQIASGDAVPILRASDALTEITRSYTKGITK